MPFIKLANVHSCKPPETRADGSRVQVGDEWLCGEEYNTIEESQHVTHTCNRIWKRSTSQRDGDYWHLDRRSE